MLLLIWIVIEVKKIITFLISTFLFCTNVWASSICDYTEQNEINAAAGNVHVTYESASETYYDGYSDASSIIEYLKIIITNVTENIYVVVTNDYNDEEMQFTYEDNEDGIITFDWKYNNQVTNFVIYVYSSENTSCPNEQYKTIYLTTPMFNRYAFLQICSELTDFPYCQKYITTEITEEEFYNKLESYQNSLIEEENVVPEEEETFATSVLNFLNNYKWYILGGVIVVVVAAGTGFIIYRIKTAKQRDLGL